MDRFFKQTQNILWIATLLLLPGLLEANQLFNYNSGLLTPGSSATINLPADSSLPFYDQLRQLSQDNDGDSTDRSGGGDDSGGKLVVGAELYAGYLAVSPKVDGLTKSVTTADSFDKVNRYGYSFFVTTTPTPLTSFMFVAPALSLSDYSAVDSTRTLDANSAEVNYGLFFNTGDLNQGRVGWYIGFLVHGTISKLDGAFEYGKDSLYTNYIYYDAVNNGSTGFDHLDVLYLSRDNTETLSDDQHTQYLLHKVGVIDRTGYMQLDLYMHARSQDIPKLLLLQTAGVSVESIHKYYTLLNEQNQKSGVFSGAGTAAEWGYQGDWFFFKHKVVFPFKLTSSKGKLYAESQTVSAGVMYKF